MSKEIDEILSTVEAIDDNQATSEEIRESDVKIAEEISSKLLYEFELDILIKPLEKIKVTVSSLEQIPESELIRNSKGQIRRNSKTGNDDKSLPENMRRVRQEVFATYQHGIVLKTPKSPAPHLADLKPGDIVVYNLNGLRPFDLFKDSALLQAHAVVARYTGSSKDLNEGQI